MLLCAGFVLLGCKSKSKERKSPLEVAYALEAVPLLELTLDEKAQKKLKKKPRKWARGSLRYGDAVVDNIGVRLKGHRSMRPLGEKSSFKVRFDKFEPDKRFWGLKNMTLNGMVEDPTTMREYLGYRLYRQMGVPAPRVGFVELSVNGERYGLYAAIETIDEGFLKHHFGDASGNLYEGEYGCDVYPEDVPGFDHDLGPDKEHVGLAALAKMVQEDPDRVFASDDSPVDRKSLLGYLAVSAFIGDFDGYRHSHNYRLYHDPAKDKWHIIPWGIDRAFKKHLSIYDSFGVLARGCFLNATCRRDYLEVQKAVVANFEKLEFSQGVTVLSAVTREALLKGDKAGYNLKTVLKERERLLEFIEKRSNEIRDEVACLGDGSGEVDADGDGFGCMDCNDGDKAVHPGADEVCDGLDNNCSGLIDDSPSCACEVVDVEGQTFHLCNLEMPWKAAAAFCEGKGLRLAKIDSAEQSGSVYRAAKKLSDKRWWIGLGDSAVEGTFEWTDGSALELDNWSKGEPDNDACHQDCAALRRGGKGKWHDTHCGQPSPFVCR
jgi:hypothetical protein